MFSREIWAIALPSCLRHLFSTEHFTLPFNLLKNIERQIVMILPYDLKIDCLQMFLPVQIFVTNVEF